MSVAHQPRTSQTRESFRPLGFGKPSWLRQTGALLLAGLAVCGSPANSAAGLSPLPIVEAVDTGDIAMRLAVFAILRMNRA